MGRSFLIIVAAISLFGAISGRIGSQSGSMPVDRATKQDDSASIPSGAEPGAANIATFSRSGGEVALERSADGHFYADVEINGTPVNMLVDTGASGVALSRDAARSAGIATSIGMNDVVGQGADGAVHGEQVRIDRIRLGSANGENVSAVVLNAGQMSLLGQDFLQRFQSVEIRDDRMILR